jgi:hypothetical protein
MNKTIKKSTLLILIATMLIASMSLMQVHARRDFKQPQPTGEFYIFPQPSNVQYQSLGDQPPPPVEEYPDAVQLLPPTEDGTYPLPNIKTPYWWVFYDQLGSLSGRVEVFVQYDPDGMSLCQQKHLRLFMWDPVDFSLDGVVNGQDIAMMLQAIKSGTYQSDFDINHDGFVNKADLLIVWQFASFGLLANSEHCGLQQDRLPWLDITAGVDLTNHYVYGFTGHFSVFGVR